MPRGRRTSVEIADRCTFSLDELRYEYPEELAPPGMTPLDYLRCSTWEGAARHPGGIPDKVRQLVEHELRLIDELRYEAYFLTVWDLVRFARCARHPLPGARFGGQFGGLLLPGRDVGRPRPDRRPVRAVHEPERNEAPDIDIDFEHERREEVHPIRLREIRPRAGGHDSRGDHLPAAFGRARRGQGARLVARQGRRAGQDARGLRRDAKLDRPLPRSRASIPQSPRAARLLRAGARRCWAFRGICRSTSAAWCMTQGPLCEMVPIENAAMPGRTVIEWDKDDLDAWASSRSIACRWACSPPSARAFDLIAPASRTRS